MPKTLRLLPFACAALALDAGSAAHGQETDEVPTLSEADDANLIAVTAAGAMACVLAAGKQSVDTTHFAENEQWIEHSDDSGFSHASEPVTISFPADSDGISRTCVVEAVIASQSDQLALTGLLINQLRQAPYIQEGHSLIWAFGGGDEFRGLQLFPDEESEMPHVRLIGAAF